MKKFISLFISLFLTLTLSADQLTGLVNSASLAKKVVTGKNLHGSKVVIFDSTGVLVKRSNIKALRNMGIKNTGKAMFKHLPSLLKAKQEFFDYMSRIPASDWAVELQSGHNATKDDKGNPLPPIMNDWQAGKVTAQYIYDELSKMDYPSNTKKNMILGIASNLLPQNLAGMMTPDKDMIALVKKLKARGHTVAIFSNFDKEGFDILVNENPELYKLFDYIFVSADIGLIKPLKEAYETIAEKMEVSPFDCVMIDDQSENVSGAQAAGMKGVLHTGAASTSRALALMKLI